MRLSFFFPAGSILLIGVTLLIAREQGFGVIALTVDYNQRHRVELEAAKRIATTLAERQIVLPLDLRAFGGSALTGDIAVPKGGPDGGIPVTYVPARNTIFLSLALGLAEAVGARDLFIGVNALDYSGYPDCRPEFIAEFERLANIATKAGMEGERFTVHAPLQHMTKADIAREAQRLGLDAGLSHSCYDPAAGRAALRRVRRVPAAGEGIRRGGDRGSDGLREERGMNAHHPPPGDGPLPKGRGGNMRSRNAS